MSTSETPIRFVVTLEARPGTDADKGLRALLKVALRRFGLKCVALREAPAEAGNIGGKP